MERDSQTWRRTAYRAKSFCVLLESSDDSDSETQSSSSESEKTLKVMENIDRRLNAVSTRGRKFSYGLGLGTVPRLPGLGDGVVFRQNRRTNDSTVLESIYKDREDRALLRDIRANLKIPKQETWKRMGFANGIKAKQDQ